MQASTFMAHGRNRLSNKCRACLPDISRSGEGTTFRCSELIQKKPDLLIVFGTGAALDRHCDVKESNWTSCAQSNYPSLMALQKAKLLSSGSNLKNGQPITVHFPVRNIAGLHMNPFK
jgi:hypothetical protein